MNQDDVIQGLQRRPAVHALCYGAFLQESLSLSDELLVVPLKALGFDAQAIRVADYAREIVGAQVDASRVAQLRQQGSQAHPVTVIAIFVSADGKPEEAQEEAEPILARCMKALSWCTGDELALFGIVVATSQETVFKLLPPYSRQRRRLGPGNTGENFLNQVRRIMEAAEQNEHFEFALTMYHDALREKNAHFRIARLFAVLESLAYKLKKGRPSRYAVRFMLGLKESGQVIPCHVGDEVYPLDAIEIAGRLRDKLFHGVPLPPGDLREDVRSVYELLRNSPTIIADRLTTYCQLEIARWANNQSRARAAAEGRDFPGAERKG